MAPGSKEGAERTERKRNLEKVVPSKGDRHQLKHKTTDIDVVMWVAVFSSPFQIRVFARKPILIAHIIEDWNFQWMQSRRKPMTDDSVQEGDWLVERSVVIIA
uniref:Uncharacterized protein n=1 Tax=Populus trichocarpa TaxID=3694 RepID=U5GCI4_POPTR